MAKRKDVPDAVKYKLNAVGLIQPYVKLMAELQKQDEKKLSNEYRFCVNTLINNKYPVGEYATEDRHKIFSLTNKFVIAEPGRLNYILFLRELIDKDTLDTLTESMKKYKRSFNTFENKAGKRLSVTSWM